MSIEVMSLQRPPSEIVLLFFKTLKEGKKFKNLRLKSANSRDPSRSGKQKRPPCMAFQRLPTIMFTPIRLEAKAITLKLPDLMVRDKNPKMLVRQRFAYG
jgi:hypothetical protein